MTALAVHNGTLVAGGSFAGSGVHQWTGSAWAPLGTGGPVPTSLTSLNGDLFATWQAGNYPPGVDRWNGSTWQTITPAYTSNGSISCATIYNGQLVVGGQFNYIDGVAANGVASWNGTNWAPVGSSTGFLLGVTALCAYNGNLIAGCATVAAQVGGIWTWRATSPVGTACPGLRSLASARRPTRSWRSPSGTPSSSPGAPSSAWGRSRHRASRAGTARLGAPSGTG